METKTYEVESYGEIGLEHSIWIQCSNLDLVKKMEIGNRLFVTFQSGAGKTTLEVTRIN